MIRYVVIEVCIGEYDVTGTKRWIKKVRVLHICRYFFIPLKSFVVNNNVVNKKQ